MMNIVPRNTVSYNYVTFASTFIGPVANLDDWIFERKNPHINLCLLFKKTAALVQSKSDWYCSYAFMCLLDARTCNLSINSILQDGNNTSTVCVNRVLSYILEFSLHVFFGYIVIYCLELFIYHMVYIVVICLTVCLHCSDSRYI